MLAPFSSDDLGRTFDARTLTRGRSLVLLGAVQVRASEDAITAVSYTHLTLPTIYSV